MLYILNKGNHPEIHYTGGQRPILHLQVDVYRLVQWAQSQRIRWAFSNRNAGVRYCQFYDSLEKLNEIDWNAVEATDFKEQAIKDGKQAEFLVYERLPWEMIEEIGVMDPQMAKHVEQMLTDSSDRPVVSVKPQWYY